MSYTPANEPVRNAPAVGDYELIDVDPYFTRVISYFRPSDYGAWGISTASFPLALYIWERLEPAAGPYKQPAKIPGGTLRAATLLGFFGGFYLAYIRSSKRFLGWSENEREVKKDRYEIKKLLSQGKLPYHEDESSLDDRLKDVANRNSQYSHLGLALLPWFNLAYHPYHGVDLNKYYVNRPGEEEWNLQLKPLDEIKAKYAKNN
ncbi:NADH-ubiquinone oxidoreductase [Spathaspora passalidarum NRRL Y-27907]|uniref:NADH-ubiquinone oxidoreductase n=1 Tax=Spathaspora passalidarum (strain NRRL Y-27907 / 11-Y1) TaxID=619300 RepID=G3AIU2_SPAPN|nr:NADH-ubiquinone oxidoreductase [Spathaspora passalidarum NRRL Y-27907]EGW33753.1 NADH-ubiquinone oxidoreductase [Spathaspora passalidarum NRRL Y-27907]